MFFIAFAQRWPLIFPNFIAESTDVRYNRVTSWKNNFQGKISSLKDKVCGGGSGTLWSPMRKFGLLALFWTPLSIIKAACHWVSSSIVLGLHWLRPHPHHRPWNHPSNHPSNHPWTTHHHPLNPPMHSSLISHFRWELSWKINLQMSQTNATWPLTH